MMTGQVGKENILSSTQYSELGARRINLTRKDVGIIQGSKNILCRKPKESQWLQGKAGLSSQTVSQHSSVEKGEW